MELCPNILLTIITVLVIITLFLIYQQVLNSQPNDSNRIKFVPSSIFHRNNK